MKLFFSAVAILLLIFSLACTQTKEDKPKLSMNWPVNPNGDSELTLLMREMFEDAMRMKEKVTKGEVPKVLKKFKDIHTVQATEPDKVASDEFKAFADAYFVTLEALQNAKPDEVSSIYRAMVGSCMSCHQAMCPGPMVKIKKLYLSHK